MWFLLCFLILYQLDTLFCKMQYISFVQHVSLHILILRTNCDMILKSYDPNSLWKRSISNSDSKTGQNLLIYKTTFGILARWNFSKHLFSAFSVQYGKKVCADKRIKRIGSARSMPIHWMRLPAVAKNGKTKSISSIKSYSWNISKSFQRNIPLSKIKKASFSS
jgi:hypothetical protein